MNVILQQSIFNWLYQASLIPVELAIWKLKVAGFASSLSTSKEGYSRQVPESSAEGCTNCKGLGSSLRSYLCSWRRMVYSGCSPVRLGQAIRKGPWEILRLNSSVVDGPALVFTAALARAVWTVGWAHNRFGLNMREQARGASVALERPDERTVLRFSIILESSRKDLESLSLE